MYWYHKETKHSYYSVRSNPNQMDWALQPSTYKNYPESFKKTELDKNNSWHGVIYYTASISTKKYYPHGTHRYLRVNPSAGALYPNELYFQARGVEGFDDGIYHYEVASNRAVLLHVLEGSEGIEPYMGYETAMQGLLFLVSAVYYRSSWKYRNRAFRYCLLDAGHLLGSIEHAALLVPHFTSMKYDIERKKLNKLFGFSHAGSAGREVFLSGASVATPLEDKVETVQFELPYAEGSETFEENEMMELSYKQTSYLLEKQPQHEKANLYYEKTRLKESIVARRSQRGFEGQAITKLHYTRIMEALTEPIPSDCDEEVELFVVLNRVQNMPIGLYHNGKLMKNADFSQKAGYLCLEQYSLGTQGAMTFFLLSTAKNYQALYQKAGIIGQRLYAVTSYLNIGCSGIGAYYDDEVNAFVEQEGMVLYALAIGR
ncbi:MAG: Unknown protein [uncultured Sulfurovum sp.]|uniref:Nitroreductase domain-containing protein n=1 Tax=uncultured Sulfurovum sp. TaxID=269237 RepID=A0A6S6TXX9_9BACT|nr:MAG: Unknown protein [uncultured Sulfurovum sp.]